VRACVVAIRHAQVFCTRSVWLRLLNASDPLNWPPEVFLRWLRGDDPHGNGQPASSALAGASGGSWNGRWRLVWRACVSILSSSAWVSRADKKKAVPGGTAKFREETSKKADSATRVALLRCTT
jgi:hypothetical protein